MAANTTHEEQQPGRDALADVWPKLLHKRRKRAAGLVRATYDNPALEEEEVFSRSTTDRIKAATYVGPLKLSGVAKTLNLPPDSLQAVIEQDWKAIDGFAFVEDADDDMKNLLLAAAGKPEPRKAPKRRRSAAS